MSFPDTISPQGRLTIPSEYRTMSGLEPGSDAIVIGVDIGVEIWNRERWQAEWEEINRHDQEKGLREVASDLLEKR
jgi:DNA-binding transcriptional regulator/RsmH inhibitor MraZ